ncbi:MAG: molybdopterin-binding protein [Chitinophagaceae bacterium]
MKKILVISFIVITNNILAQEKINATNQFSVQGKIKNQLNFSQNDLTAFASHFIDSVVIYNHLMQPRKTIKNIKGVLLKDILEKAAIDAGSPKLLSEFYITCIASDNYKVVFSWNEIFNSDTGDQLLIITEGNGQKGDEMADSIALLSPSDRATGRRYVKGLQKIVIEQVK